MSYDSKITEYTENSTEMSVLPTIDMNSSMHFTVYTYNFLFDDSKYVTRQFIVLKHSDGILQFTDFHKYIGSPTSTVKKFTSDGNSRFYFVVQLLNYAFFHVGITKLDNITGTIISDFLNAYGMCKLPWDTEYTKRTESTVKRCIRTVLDFMELYLEDRKSNCLIKTSDLLKRVNRRDKHGRAIKVKIPKFKVIHNGSKRAIYRDIPNKAFWKLFNHIAAQHKDMLGLIMLSAFAGLRPSEACNVRLMDSPLGPGILFDMVNGEVQKIQIDLLTELNLRSDMVSVGKIKKERMQPVPDIFLEVFFEAYTLYMKYRAGKMFEKEYGPFTVNRNGKAITYENYRQKFHTIMSKEVIPLFLEDTDPDVVLFGRILLQHRLSPHVFRHWYTVQLVLSGIEEPGVLMHWRGDSSPESVLRYLQDKGELEKQYRKVNNEMFDYLMWAAAGGNHDRV